MADMQKGMNTSRGMGFYWHKQPKEGFYCIYRARPGETNPPLPDCPGITATLTRHAAMLTSVGVDFIVSDSTNFAHTGTGADVLQLRPFEVVAEEWLELRKAGVDTPRVAIWQNLQSLDGDLFKSYLALYRDPANAGIIHRDAHTGKMVFFATADPQPALVAEIESEGDIVVVTMWAERANGFGEGEFSFFSPCTDATTGQFTSSVVSNPAVPCNQASTTNAKIGAHGTSITVAPSYQLSYSSLPFMASGDMGGLTHKKQFEKAFGLHATGSLDYLIVAAFNEHIAQPEHNPYGNNTVAISMGMEGDPFGQELWVDMYGMRSRDIEPTVEDNGRAWTLFESCMRVFRSGAATCSNATELCCGRSDPAQTYRSVYSLELIAGGDNLLTHDLGERNALVTSGAWAEICSPVGGSTVFCKPKAPEPAATWTRGPFVAFAPGIAPEITVAPINRCVSRTGGKHFITATLDCRGGVGKLESVLGHTAAARNSNTPRSLRLCGVTPCTSTAGCASYYHQLDGRCETGDVFLEFLGFVH